MNGMVRNSVSSPVVVPAMVPSAGTATAVATQRVLHVVNGEHYSGAERVQDLLAAELPRFGFDVAFACVKPYLFPSMRKTKEATLHRTPMHGRIDFGCARRLTDLICEEEYALVHAHTPRSLLVGSQAALRAGVPLVYHVHSPTARDSTRRIQNFFNARLEHWSLRRASRLIAVSPSLKQFMQDQGFDQGRITYVPNGVPEMHRIDRTVPTGCWTLGMAALFRPRKGVEVLIEALAAIRSRGGDVRLRAVGPFETPEYEREVKSMVVRLGVKDAIDWTGFTDDIGAELRQIDLFVLPSLFGEGLPMVVLEAMAAGLPVIASHVEGVPEAIRHRHEGLLVEPASVSQLSSAIEELIAGDAGIEYEQFCENSRLRHAKSFSVRAMALNVAEVYRGALRNE